MLIALLSSKYLIYISGTIVICIEKVIFFVKSMYLPKVSFSSCQRNLIKTFQIEAMIALITKMAMIFS